jgi:hypothetical protein
MVAVDPRAAGAEATAQGDRYPRENGIWDSKANAVRLAGAANEVLTFQLVVEKRAGRLQDLRLEGADGLKLDVFQNVTVPVGENWADDPLVPVNLSSFEESAAGISRKAPRLKGRRRQVFTLEVQVPRGTPPGERTCEMVLRVGGEEVRARLIVRVHAFELPDENHCAADINSYSRVPYPGGVDADTDCDGYVEVMTAYFRMARDHRAVFHILPYSQTARLSPGYAPRLAGRGRNRRVADWSPFDRHWGRLLDGSAFRGSRCGDGPLEYLYLPVSLDWPAYFENYGKPGFKVEFQNVMREMAAHFAERGWTRTRFEVFFNHKTRWKYFPWDMDEIRFDRDNYATAELARMATEAVRDFPGVKFLNRIDSSWIFPESARTELGDLIQLWVVSRWFHSRYPDEVELLRGKGQEVFYYGGPGPVDAPDRLDNLRHPWVTWGRESDGFTLWNGLGWGKWEAVGPGKNHCMYPGERFGIRGPLASLRLKAVHRGMQDHAYLSLLSERTGSRRAADEVVGAAIGAAGREDWYQRGEGTGGSGTEIEFRTATTKPWNSAPLEAWNRARAGLARAVEKA